MLHRSCLLQLPALNFCPNFLLNGPWPGSEGQIDPFLSVLLLDTVFITATGRRPTQPRGHIIFINRQIQHLPLYTFIFKGDIPYMLLVLTTELTARCMQCPEEQHSSGGVGGLRLGNGQVRSEREHGGLWGTVEAVVQLLDFWCPVLCYQNDSVRKDTRHLVFLKSACLQCWGFSGTGLMFYDQLGDISGIQEDQWGREGSKRTAVGFGYGIFGCCFKFV